MNENFTFLNIKMDSLAEKNDCTQSFFSYREKGKADKSCLIERTHLMLSL